jgi:Leucine-rich repeat (LRR) protein
MKKYLEFIKESAEDKEINIYSEKDFHKIKEGVENIFASAAKLTYLPELPNGLNVLYCRNNDLKSLPKLPESLLVLYCRDNKLTYLPELSKNLQSLECSNNPLEYPIPHKFYNRQDRKWLEELNTKLSSYEHQKKLIKENGVYIMKKYENHPELINDKIKEENPTYFLSVEYGF